MFVFADINCSLALKLNDENFHYFQGEDEFNNILQKYVQWQPDLFNVICD